MRRVNWPFAVGLIITVAAAAGGFHALHVARYGQIADDLRLQVGRARDDGRPDDAIKFAAQYLDFRPADVGMMADLAGWLREKAQTRKQLTSVLGLYVRMLRYAPDDNATRQKAAELAMSLGDWAAALDNFEVLLGRRPDDAELCEDYAYCLQVIGKFDDSVRWYERSVRADPKRVSAYVGHAAVLYQGLRQPDKALARVEEACQANPTSGFVHAERARYLCLKGRLDDAAKAVAEARKYPTDNARHQQWIIEVAADVEQSAGHYAAARKLLEDGTRDYPKNSRFVCNLAWQHLFDGRADLAIATLREARERSTRDKVPHDADVLTLLGDLLAQEGQVGPLDDALKQLTEMNAPADRVQYVQARLLLRRGRWAESAALLDKLRMVSLQTPSLYRQTNLLLAQCYEQLGDTAGELDAYRRLLENDPNAGTVRLDFAKALARAGQADEAASQLLSVVSRPEVSSRAVAEAARILFDQLKGDPKVWGGLEKAVDAFKIENNNSNTALARAYLDLARNRPADSIAMIDGLVRTNPRSAALHVARAKLAEQVFGIDRALAALTDGEVVLGDQPDFRVVRAKLFTVRMDRAFADGLTTLARGVERFNADDRARILREVIAAFRTLDDSAAVGLHLDLLARLRPDLLAAREALYARALKAGDESRCRAVRTEVEGIEGPDGPTARLLDAQRLMWLAQSGDTAALSKAADQLLAAARGRPHDPVVEFLRGRVDELAGRPTEALHHYQAAFAAGLADRPIEDLFANLLGKSGSAPVAILRDQLPLSDRLRPERHRSLIAAAIPLYDSAGLTALAARLTAAVPPSDAITHAWLGRLFARHNLNSPAEQCFQLASADAPQSPEGWLALVAYQTERGNDAGTEAAAAQVREKMAPIEAHLVVGQAFESVRRFDAAQKEYEIAAGLNPNDTRPLKALVTLATICGRPDEARQQLEQMIALSSPSAPEDQAWARRTLARQLATTPSADAFRRALVLLDQNKVGDQAADDDQRIRVLVLAAQKSRLLAGTKTTARQEAIRILEDLRKRGSARSAEDLILLAGLYRAEGDSAGSRQAQERMAAEYPEHFGCTVFRAREALRDHDLPACEALLPALRLGPGQFDGLAVEFQYRVLAGAADNGRRLLDNYITAAATAEDRAARAVRCANLIFDLLQLRVVDERSPAFADLRANAIGLYRPTADRNGDAFQRLVTLLASQPDGTDPAIELVQRARRVFGPEAAAAAYVEVIRRGKPSPNQREAMKRYIQDAIDKAPQSMPLRLSWAEYLQLAGENAEAVAVYREVLRREPENILALNNLAWTMSLDRRDEANLRESLSYIQRAIDVAGPLDELLDTRARILFESGQQGEALRDMCDAVNQAPSAARLNDYALMLQKAGKPQEAEKALAAARRFSPGAH
jgi:tetratricopeptide (TPR) repeat protein